MPRLFASMIRFSIWSRHAEPVAAADRVHLADDVDGIADRKAVLERDRHDLRRDLDVRVPVRDAHDRLDDAHARVEVLEVLRLVRRAEHVRVGRVRLLGRRAVRETALGEPLAHLLAPAELRHERGVEPRLVDAQVLVREQAVAVEALDVVALVRRAVAPDLDAELLHRVHEQRAGDGAAERRRVEVALAGRLHVERAALERGEPLARERVLAVDEHRVLGAVADGALRDGRDVGLVRLAEIGGERVRNSAVLAHPRERAARVEPAGEGDADVLADRERGEDHATPRSMCPRISSASFAPVVPSRAMSRTVFSPAIVPAMRGWCATSIACASGLAYPYGVTTTTRLPLGSTSSAQRANATAIASARSASAACGGA